MNKETIIQSFEELGKRWRYDLTPAVDPTEERRYANRHTQELFNVWEAAIRSMNALGGVRVADLSDRQMPEKIARYRTVIYEPKHIKDEA